MTRKNFRDVFGSEAGANNRQQMSRQLWESIPETTWDEVNASYPTPTNRDTDKNANFTPP